MLLGKNFFLLVRQKRVPRTHSAWDTEKALGLLLLLLEPKSDTFESIVTTGRLVEFSAEVFL